MTPGAGAPPEESISKHVAGNSFLPEPSVLFLVPGDFQRQTGGSIYNRNLVEGLVERGFRFELHSIPDLPYFMGLGAGLFIAPLLLIRLSSRKYDLIIEDGWTHPTTLLFNLVCRLTGNVRLVIIEHQVRSATISNRFKLIARMVEKLALSSAQLIVTASAFLSGAVERLVGENSDIAIASPGSGPHAGPERIQRDSQEQPLRLLFVGNCTPLKGLDYLIEAISLLKDLDLRLDIVGDVSIRPRYCDELVRKTNDLDIDKRITFHGAISSEDIGRFYSQADIFTFPSLYEGFGIVLAEAMHAGLPIVATRTGPVNEIIREGENALLVPPADSAALAGAIRKLAADPSMRKSFGRVSHQLAGSLPTWNQACDTVFHRIRIMIRTTPDTKQTTRKIPTR